MGSISAFIWKKYSSHIIQLITFDIGNKTLKKIILVMRFAIVCMFIITLFSINHTLFQKIVVYLHK